MGLRTRSVVQAETKVMTAGDIRRVVRNVVLFSLGVELVVAAVLASRFYLAYEYSLRSALYSGVFPLDQRIQ
jgi:Trk-type K+ transport system membrane component